MTETKLIDKNYQYYVVFLNGLHVSKIRIFIMLTKVQIVVKVTSKFPKLRGEFLSSLIYATMQQSHLSMKIS